MRKRRGVGTSSAVPGFRSPIGCRALTNQPGWLAVGTFRTKTKDAGTRRTEGPYGPRTPPPQHLQRCLQRSGRTSSGPHAPPPRRVTHTSSCSTPPKVFWSFGLWSGGSHRHPAGLGGERAAPEGGAKAGYGRRSNQHCLACFACPPEPRWHAGVRAGVRYEGPEPNSPDRRQFNHCFRRCRSASLRDWIRDTVAAINSPGW